MYLQQRADSTLAMLVPIGPMIFLVGKTQNPLPFFWLFFFIGVVVIRLLLGSRLEVVAFIVGCGIVFLLLLPGITVGFLTPGNRLIASRVVRDLRDHSEARLRDWLTLFPNACPTCGCREIEIYDVTHPDHGWLYSVWTCPSGHEAPRSPGMNLPPFTGSRHLQKRVTIPLPLWVSPKHARALSDLPHPVLQNNSRGWIEEFVGIPALATLLNFLFGSAVLVLSLVVLA